MKIAAEALVCLMTPGSAKGYFRALAALRPGSVEVGVMPVSLQSYPETDAVVQRVLETYHTSARPKLWTRLIPEGARRALLGWQYNGMRRLFDRRPGAVALCWNGMDRKRLLFAEAARHAGRVRLFSELAPLPGYLTLDPSGINAGNSLSREAGFYRQWAQTHPADGDWRSLAEKMTARAPKKTKPAQPSRRPPPPGPFVFAPLQVPGDSQLRYFGGWTRSIPAFLTAVDQAAAHLPAGWHMRIKQHPSARVDFADAIAALPSGRCYLDDETDTFDQVKASAAVLTVNSSVGLQSFFFDKPVIALGEAFYGFEPLVQLASGQERLNALLSKPETLEVDNALRAAFMRYLQEVYFIPASLKSRPHLLGDAALRIERAIQAAAQSAGKP